MFRRMTVLIGAAALASATLGSLTAATASAAPDCPDVHWIGAAGSGERDGDPTANGGMGRVIYQSYRDLQQRLQQDGKTVTAEAVEYPAVAVPPDGDLMGWAGFINSVDTGTGALGQQYATFAQRCPNTKMVLAGYSQGAMVVHRNLQGLADQPNLAAALLVADGDRLPNDTVVTMGSAPGGGRGVAQEWPTLAHAPAAPLPPQLGARTISVCDSGDPVCDTYTDSEKVTPARVAIHTSYAVSQSGKNDWVSPLQRMIESAPSPNPAPTVAPVS